MVNSSGAGIDNRNIFFEFPDLDKITGEPNGIPSSSLKNSLSPMPHPLRPILGMAFTDIWVSFYRNYVTWPGIDAINFKKHLDPTVKTAKGHLLQERKNLQSTQHPVPIKQEHPAYVQDPTEFSPPPDSPNVKSYECFATIVDQDSKSGKAFHDLTGRFPHTSSRGSK